MNRELQCKIYPAGIWNDYMFVVVCSYYQGKILLSRRKDRDSWETQGGHIEAGETPLDAAKRELFEESGVTEADVISVCDYLGYDTRGSAYGAVYLARVRALGELPESEMAEVRLFEALPENLTYPNVTPKLFCEAQRFLGE
ncbi:MAG: NUDIX domain-containing protein [Clostridia bacterium]|nr:NUDIX domain-containing protein [Clostridia bacterium]